jgi:hypothetical protein
MYELRPLRRLLPLLLATAAMLAPLRARAEEGHGPSAEGLPSHRFQLAPHSYDAPQLNVHFGLLQPLLTHGVNVAADLRLGPWVFEYSHGMFLHYSDFAGSLSSAERDAGIGLYSPWTTGFGIGHNVVDDLYLMVEVKAHRYEVSLDGATENYTTMSVGPAVGWRFFVYKGLDVTTYVRWWPNVWSSSSSVTLATSSGAVQHQAHDLGLFANVSVGWAFDLAAPRPRS